MISTVVPGALAAAEDDPTLKVSRIIVGRDDLDPALAKRVYAALSERIDGFDQKLSTLVSALSSANSAGADRDAALSRLDDASLDLALQIAQPWYTGVAGDGARESLDDDAVFVTYLGAEALRMISDVTPIQTYSTGAPGWWAQTPVGVTAPAMPPEILDWGYAPPGAEGPVAQADPQFIAMVTPQEP